MSIAHRLPRSVHRDNVLGTTLPLSSKKLDYITLNFYQYTSKLFVLDRLPVVIVIIIGSEKN